MKDIAYGELFGEEIDELEQSAAKRPKVTSDALVDNRLRNLQNVFLSSITQQTTPAIAEGAKGRPSGPVEDALYAPLRYDDLAVSGMEDEDLFSGLEESSKGRLARRKAGSSRDMGWPPRPHGMSTRVIISSAMNNPLQEVENGRTVSKVGVLVKPKSKKLNDVEVSSDVWIPPTSLRDFDPSAFITTPSNGVRRKLFDLDFDSVSSVSQQKRIERNPVQTMALNSDDQQFERTLVCRRPPRDPHVSFMGAGGLYYIRLKGKNWQSEVADHFSNQTLGSMRSAESWNKFRSVLDTVRCDMERQPVAQPEVLPSMPEVSMPVVKEMWVDKYRPSKYLDLLSDEAVNRALLHWLKLWDSLVFNRDPKFLDPYKDFGKRKKQNGKSDFQPRKFGAAPDFCFTLDTDKRPRFKAALLCGPPGLGKTTLAHVIAHHAGYDTLEINASDDRALEIFRNRVESSIRNGNIATMVLDVSHRSDKPKCLIIDEIDGAPANTVEYLVDLLKGEAKSAASKKKGKKLGLWRPIICICNDQYVPALKTLRQNTMLLQFPPINRERLTQRLLGICRDFSVQTDTSVLSMLCEKSEDDIRTCLNSLQFVSIKKQKIGLGDVSVAALGCKDHRKQLFSVWSDIFRTQKTFPSSGVHQDMGTAKDPVGKILGLVQLGEMEKVLSGVYENYLIVKHRDSRMIDAATCADWMAYVDVMERAIREDQNWFLMGYVAFYPVAIHVLLNNAYVPKLNFPMKQVESFKMLTRNKDVLEAFLKDLSPDVYRSSKSNRISTELVPYLTHILQPSLKGTNVQLMKGPERVSLRSAVDVMIEYGISYREDYATNGIHSLLFEPQLEHLTTFPGINPGPTLSTSVREIISRELQIRKIHMNVSTSSEETADEQQETAEEVVASPVADPVISRTIAQNPTKLQVWSVYDYFRQHNPSQATKPVTAERNHKVWYRYKEGYSNAVCRDIKIKDLM